MDNLGPLFGVVLGVGIFFVVIVAYTVFTTLQICEPSEVMIISGRTSMCEGKRVGYSPQQGWAIKWPVIEKVYKMDLRNMTVDVTCHDAFSKEGVPLNVEGVANLKVCGRQPLLNNAVERFMGMPREHIMRIARETLEGNLRGVLATMTPEEVNHDKVKFAESLVEEADKDLQRLGLELDNLKIQNIHDAEGYLDSLGKLKQSEQRQENRLAEESNREQAGVNRAENHQKKTIAELDNEMRVVRANAETRIADAETRRDAVVKEEEAKVAQELAKAEAEIGVYEALIDQVKHQLEADVLQPARAAKEKALAEARATTAPIRESGRATAEMLQGLIDAWKVAGPGAYEVFRMQKLDGFLDTMMRTLPDVEFDRLTVVGSGSGNGASGDLPPRLVAAYEQLRGATGVDVAGVLGSSLGGAPQGAARAEAEPASPRRQAPAPPRPEPARQAQTRKLPPEVHEIPPPQPPQKHQRTQQTPDSVRTRLQELANALRANA
jgi:flotillin